MRGRTTVEAAIRYHLKSIILTLVFIVPLLYSAPASGDEMKSNPCLKCHQDVYIKAVSFKYKHSVVTDQCTLCHIYPEKRDDIITQIIFQPLQREFLVYLDRLSEDLEYQAEVTVTDIAGKSCTPKQINITQKDLWVADGQRASLKLLKVTGVMIDEIKKLGFVSVAIVWDTDAFATSEIEYRSPGKRTDTFKTRGLYTKTHRIILDGLKHNTRYNFRAVSRDVYGNTLTSDEYSFDTSEEYSRPSGLMAYDPIPPVVEQLQVFRSSGNEGLYLKVSANKPCDMSVKIKQVRGENDKHGAGLLPARYSRIDVCLQCHPHDSSHPVGVKAVSPKIHAPEGLPTIEDGIITCVTCHKPHGGDLAHFNRFDYRKDLCMRCHLQKYST